MSPPLESEESHVVLIIEMTLCYWGIKKNQSLVYISILQQIAWRVTQEPHFFSLMFLYYAEDS